MEARRLRIVILGSTGSIGRQALEVATSFPQHLEVVGLAAGSDHETLERQASEHGVRRTALGSAAAAELATLDEADMVVNAIVGAAGLAASVNALEAGKILALANKESLVAGGELCLAAAQRGAGASIVPVDSEHAAIAQCLEGRPRTEIQSVILTASGGPFRDRPQLDGVTVDDALAHPTWDMGPKITVDSATLMNKGLEVIEAHHLFGLGYDAIEVLVHRESIVHGMVRLRDGSIIMQAAPTDMRLPLQAALMSDRRPLDLPAIELERVGALHFEAPDHARFPALGLAYEAGAKGRSYPAVLNGANEHAVRAFLAGTLPFVEIAGVVEAVLEAHDPMPVDSLDAVLTADAWARSRADRIIDERARSRQAQRASV